jgi:DNA-binding NarL/FixJ family response regulator
VLCASVHHVVRRSECTPEGAVVYGHLSMDRPARSEPLEATVVVVDDEPALLEIISITLGTAGPFEVVGRAKDGTEALALAEEHQPDVVLLDLILGAERGVDLVAPLMRTSPRSMIAALTALPAEAEEATTLRAGAFVFYEKGMLTSLPDYLRTDLTIFRRALEGEDVVAPSALVRRPRTTPPVGLEVDDLED